MPLRISDDAPGKIQRHHVLSAVQFGNAQGEHLGFGDTEGEPALFGDAAGEHLYDE